MQLSVTFRHMDATDAIKEYAREKIEKINRYFPEPIKAHMTFVCERGFHHVADVTIILRNGILIKGQESTEDMYSSIDLVMAKIERQVRRYKEKIRTHRTNGDEHEILHTLISMPSEAEAAPEPVMAAAAAGGEAEAAVVPSTAPRVIRKSKFIARPLSVEEAVMQLNLLHNSFLVFTNAASKEVNVIYRRDDGTYGLIETGAARA
jgi:putative sigma-54 modulation protein